MGFGVEGIGVGVSGFGFRVSGFGVEALRRCDTTVSGFGISDVEAL